jgi:hypothetical protein
MMPLGANKGLGETISKVIIGVNKIDLKSSCCSCFTYMVVANSIVLFVKVLVGLDEY